jgi:hypothetical protein
VSVSTVVAIRVLLLVVALVVVGAVAPQSASARCRAPAGATVVAHTSRAVVWSAAVGVVGCLRSGRAVVLDRVGEDVIARDIVARIAGRFAAVSTTRCDDREGVCMTTKVSVWDLRSRRRIAKRAYDDVNGNDVYAQLDDMVVSSRGAAAVLLTVAANREVWLVCPDYVEREAAASNIAARLQRIGPNVWWSYTSGERRREGVRFTCRRRAST